MTILADLNDVDAVRRAIDENAAGFLLALGQAGGGQELNAPHIHWTIGGSPIDYHNAVVWADLRQTEQPAEAVIQDVISQFRAQGVPGSWHVGPLTQPANLGDLLVAHGFENNGEPGMAAELLALNENVSYPSELMIERVRDEAQLQTWAQTLAQGFGEGEREANWVRDVYRVIGLGDSFPLRHYIGWLKGESVATASVFLGAGVVGIYFVMTVPQARRQGIGAAMTLAALKDARELGYRVGVLGASDAGVPVYERIGFRTFCQIGVYEWHES